MTLVEFLRARLDEDEAAARAASPGPWAWEERMFGTKTFHSLVSDVPMRPDEVGWEAMRRYVVIPSAISDVYPTKADAAHIARHNPARVLAEVDAKRRIVDLHAPAVTEYIEGDVCLVCDERSLGEPFYPCLTLRLLALPYAAHPSYNEAWRP